MSKGVKKKGFTLAELVVVLAIFGLLASITGLGLYSWTRYSINKENNENARTIFLAAQESLTHMQASGTLKDFGELIVSKGDDDSFGAIQKTPPAIASAANRSDSLYTIFYEPGTLDRNQSEVNTIIKETILPYLEGTGVFSHPFALELDPIDGVVYSAFYSSKAESLYYENNEIRNESGKVGIFYRDEGILKDRLLGFYHTELTVAKPTEIPVIYFPQIDETDDKLLKNEEELYYRIITKGIEIDKNNLGQYTFELNIYAKTHNKNAEIITLTINGKDLYESINNHGIATFKATYIKNNGHKEYDDVKLKVDIKSNEIKVVFDSIDVVTIQKILSTNTMKLEQKNKANYLLGFKETFKDTFSIFSLLRNTEGLGAGNVDSSDGRIDFFNISCGGKILRNGSEYAKLGNSEPENILFEDIEEKNDGFEIKIKNLRHLFNICFFEEIKNNGSQNLNITYNQTKDIIYKDDYIFSSASVNKKPDPLETIAFPSLEKLNTYSTYNGANYSIDSLKLNSDLIKTYPNNQISHNNNYQKNLGIFEVNNGTIQNATLKDLKLFSKISSTDEKSSRDNMSYGSGGFVGVNSGTIKDCKVLSGEINGNVNVGGIAGINENTIDGCESSLLINSLSLGGYNFGGIAGLNTSNGTINDCEYTATRQMRPITESQQNPFVSESPRYNELLGYNIGGIAGKNDSNAKIINCSTNSVDDGYIVGYGSVGGVVGLYSTETVLDGSNNGNRSINEINVVGVDCIGGIVGNLDSCDDFSRTITNWENQGAIIAIDDDKVDASFGGITAYIGKKGTVSNCKVNVSSTSKKLEMLAFSDGNNIGGICGVLRGQIISDETVEHNVLVYGHDNVGGLVGKTYDDNVERNIKNQTVSSGVVYGDDYVGGLIGYNDMDFGTYNSKFDNVVQNGAKVYGDMYIGGVIGYNNNRLVSDGIITHNISLVSGKNSVGGFAGYNNSIVNNQMVKIESIVAIADNVGGFIGNNEGELFSYRDGKISAIVETIEGRDNVGGFVGHNIGELVLNNINTNINNYSEIVKGNNNIGGFIGLNENSIFNNGTEIYSEANHVEGNNGVSGFIGNNLSNLTNNKKISISVNEIVGNKNTGGVFGNNTGECLNNREMLINIVKVIGVENTGGLAGNNEGNIKNLIFNVNFIESSGNYTGGVSGVNKGAIYLDNKNAIKVNVNSTGNFIGGLAGWNIVDVNDKGKIFNYDISDCVISGYNNAGGLYGLLETKCDYVFENYTLGSASITGNDYVGGLFGTISSDYNVKISGADNFNCVIDGATIVANNGIAGGIVPVLDINATISKVKVLNSSITSKGGECGAIAAINNSAIDNSYIENTKISGKTYVGSLIGYNNGSIKKSRSVNTELSSDSNTNGELVGLNGSLKVIDPKKMSVIEDCIAANYQSDNSINRTYDLSFENYANIIGCSSYYGNNESIINNVKNINNEYQKVNNPEITIENYSDSINFKLLKNPGNSPVYNLVISGYDYNLENIHTIEIFNESIDTNSSSNTSIICIDNHYIYEHSINEEIDRYKINVKHLSNQENLLDSVSEINYYYHMELPSVAATVERTSEKGFIISWKHVENPIYNYQAGYDVAYQINDEEPVIVPVAKDINTYTFNFDDSVLNKNVKFWVVAKAGEYVFYKDSVPLASSSYLIGEDSVPPITEENH